MTPELEFDEEAEALDVEMQSLLQQASEPAEVLERVARAARWVPMEGSQLQCFLSQADICLYGGAAGGGKSALLAGIAATVAESSLLVRREASQLVPLIDEIKKVLGGDTSGLNSQNGVWRLPGGRTIRLGGCKDPGDEYRYQGSARDFLGVDEAALLLESQMRGLLAWVRPIPRRGKTPPRTRTVLCSNPPTGADGLWLQAWFAPWLDKSSSLYPTPAGQLRWIVMIPNEGDRWVEGPAPIHFKGETLLPTSRTFFPATVQSNIYLRNTSTARNLASLPEPLRSQLLYGDWSAARRDDYSQIIPAEWLRLSMQDTAAPTEPLTCIGVDPSRGGADECIVALRFGRVVAPLVAIPAADTTNGSKIAQRIMRILEEHKAPDARIIIDAAGSGSSAVDHLLAFVDDPRQVIPFMGASEARGYDIAGNLKFSNARTEAIWSLRDRLDPTSPFRLRLPNDARLQADLSAVSWSMTARGTTALRKEDVHAKLGRSPDRGDAVVLACLRGGLASWR